MVTSVHVLPVDRVRKMYENKTSKQDFIIAEFNTFLISKCEKTLSQDAVMVPIFVDVNVVWSDIRICNHFEVSLGISWKKDQVSMYSRTGWLGEDRKGYPVFMWTVVSHTSKIYKRELWWYSHYVITIITGYHYNYYNGHPSVRHGLM